jgi:tetratricopeptide (TPR) repeat protein
MIGNALKVLFLSLFVIMTTASFGFTDDNEQKQLDQYMSELKKNPYDASVREKIIRHVETMKNKPAIPEAAERGMARGKVAFERAKSPDDFKDAIQELQKAVDAAPWLAAAYYNLGLAQENADNLEDAIKSFKLYLVAAASAKDAQAVKSRIYGIEYKIEQKGKSVSAADDCDRFNRAGHLNDALAACREAVRLDPKYSIAHYNLGVVLRSRHGSDEPAIVKGCTEAAPEFQEAIRLGHGLDAYTLLGNCYFYSKDYLRAKSIIEEGMSSWGFLSEPGSMSYAHCQLANAYYQLGEREKALFNYEKAKGFGMVDPLVDNRINMLRRALGR